MTIDTTDYAILQCINDADEPIWKKKICTRINDRINHFPGIEHVSVQTIGRRVDRLHDNAHLESCIVPPEHLRRDLIIAYKLTDEGVTSLHEKRQQLLFTRIQQPETAEKALILSLLEHEIGFARNMHDFLQDQTTEQLLALTEIYFMRKHLGETVDTTTLRKLRPLLDELDVTPITQATEASADGV